MFKKLLFAIFLGLFSVILTQECGKRGQGFTFSVGGEYSEVGQWPWLAPLFRKENDKFFCSSSIISERFLLSGKKMTYKLRIY
jgi:hypothetical protein